MTNHLFGESSPYLLQHKDNPVNWHPWGEAALGGGVRVESDIPPLYTRSQRVSHFAHPYACHPAKPLSRCQAMSL